MVTARFLEPRAPAMLLVAGLAIITAVACGLGLNADEPADARSDRVPGRDVVVLELFTSQGCSSCPPADSLLSELATDPRLAERVVPLSFHVDYWNYLGWRDPFSDAKWSERQERYARALRTGRVYTPQLVVDGRADLVGSREQQVRSAIDEALGRPAQARIEVEITAPQQGELVVDLSAHRLEGGGGPLVLMTALVETGLDTAVGRGENAGRELANDHVVRRLTEAATLEGGQDSTRARVTFPLASDWKHQNLAVAAFLQDPRSMEIAAGAIARR